MVGEAECEGILNGVKENGSGFVGFCGLGEGLVSKGYVKGIGDNCGIGRGGLVKKEGVRGEVLSKIEGLNEGGGMGGE